MQNKIFVRNLPFMAEQSDVRNLFGSFGDVISVRIPLDRQTGRARGFGFVEMSTALSAENAIRELNTQEFCGRKIHVTMSEQRDQRSLTYGMR